MSTLSCIRTAAITLATLAWVVPGAGAAPAATVGSVDCAAGGSIVSLSNDGGVPVRFVVLRDDAVVASVVVPAGTASVQRVVPIAEGAAAQVTARFGASYASSYVRRACGSGATAAPTSSPTAATTNVAPERAAAPYPAAPVIPATGARTVQTPAQPAPAPATSERVPQLEEPASSMLVLMLAAIAALAVAGALLVRFAGRRDVEADGAQRRQEAAR